MKKCNKKARLGKTKASLFLEAGSRIFFDEL